MPVYDIADALAPVGSVATRRVVPARASQHVADRHALAVGDLAKLLAVGDDRAGVAAPSAGWPGIGFDRSRDAVA